MAVSTRVPSPTVEQAKAASVVANLRYRAHVESCYLAYLGKPCVNCQVLDGKAAAADWALDAARIAADWRLAQVRAALAGGAA